MQARKQGIFHIMFILHSSFMFQTFGAENIYIKSNPGGRVLGGIETDFSQLNTSISSLVTLVFIQQPVAAEWLGQGNEGT